MTLSYVPHLPGGLPNNGELAKRPQVQKGVENDKIFADHLTKLIGLGGPRVSGGGGN